MDNEEYHRLKAKAEELLAEANKHVIGDATFVGIGLAIEAQAYATLAAAEAARPATGRRAVAATTSMTYELPPDLVQPRRRTLPVKRLPVDGDSDALPPSYPAEETPAGSLS